MFRDAKWRLYGLKTASLAPEKRLFGSLNDIFAAHFRRSLRNCLYDNDLRLHANFGEICARRHYFRKHRENKRS